MDTIDYLEIGKWKKAIGALPARFFITLESGELQLYYKKGTSVWEKPTIVCSHYVGNIVRDSSEETKIIVQYILANVTNFQKEADRKERKERHGKKNKKQRKTRKS